MEEHDFGLECAGGGLALVVYEEFTAEHLQLLAEFLLHRVLRKQDAEQQGEAKTVS